MYFNTFPIMYIFHFLVIWKTENPLQIHLVHLLADKNEYIDG